MGAALSRCTGARGAQSPGEPHSPGDTGHAEPRRRRYSLSSLSSSSSSSSSASSSSSSVSSSSSAPSSGIDFSDDADLADQLRVIRTEVERLQHGLESTLELQSKELRRELDDLEMRVSQAGSLRGSLPLLDVSARPSSHTLTLPIKSDAVPYVARPRIGAAYRSSDSGLTISDAAVSAPDSSSSALNSSWDSGMSSTSDSAAIISPAAARRAERKAAADNLAARVAHWNGPRVLLTRKEGIAVLAAATDAPAVDFATVYAYYLPGSRSVAVWAFFDSADHMVFALERRRGLTPSPPRTAPALRRGESHTLHPRRSSRRRSSHSYLPADCKHGRSHNVADTNHELLSSQPPLSHRIARSRSSHGSSLASDAFSPRRR
ncbi:uncharacterized protein AMSG_09347 [Thecamonas trahens ATCC 50062]|uniref:Uncharacterized protein n=1 Tax=Thecamonas trahens ATCC 50062 TaxID=461836 RepID=A0A0L0DNQ7_THETB|nr:hypothetical protein AMSG_09347 [Thecamonas trahens ATCC 50062]KNC53053.1 hypothetical protein AMSG_09347 [Thecamonas trahens ATCC 50062]|eukprot:XP_013754729.1 hypothetical protein AMSG_09347 [Thecamonas trahens ATCC 50062]